VRTPREASPAGFGEPALRYLRTRKDIRHYEETPHRKHEVLRASRGPGEQRKTHEKKTALFPIYQRLRPEFWSVPRRWQRRTRTSESQPAHIVSALLLTGMAKITTGNHHQTFPPRR